MQSRVVAEVSVQIFASTWVMIDWVYSSGEEFDEWSSACYDGR